MTGRVIFKIFRSVIGSDKLGFQRRWQVLLSPCSHLIILASNPPIGAQVRCQVCEREVLEYRKAAGVTLAVAKAWLESSFSPKVKRR